MRSKHNRNTVRYYLIVILLFAFLFFSNDFGLLDIQKTAIVMAAGIDREGDTFIVTSQIAIPQSSTQGKATEAVQIVSRGNTVAEAFEEINAKTGWYPKLVFCDLILLGKNTTQSNVFDALDYFLRNEYLTDNCLVAACDGYAKDLLNNSALVDPSSSVAMRKVLSAHAERVGTVLPTTLREFSIGYFSESKSGFLPILKSEPQQEKIGSSSQNSGSDSSSSQSSSEESESSSESSGASGSDSTSESGSSSESSSGDFDSSKSSAASGQKDSGKPVFSARETALFVHGKRVGTLTEEETFAFGAVKNQLRLAAYSVERNGKTCTLTVKRNSPKINLNVGKNGRAELKIHVTMAAGILDYSQALPLEKITDVGDTPKEFFTSAQKKLSAQIMQVFEKSRSCGCDLFGLQERLIKYEKKHLHQHSDSILENTTATVTVEFQNIR